MSSALMLLLCYLSFSNLLFTSVLGFSTDTNGSSEHPSTRTSLQNGRVKLQLRFPELLQKNKSVADNTSDVSFGKLDEKRKEFSYLPLSESSNYFADHTGFYPISTNNGARMFYSFFECRDTTEYDKPIMIWLNGGPGLTSNVGLFYGNGPFRFKNDDENDFDLSWNKFGWDKVAHILYIDQPMGTGFSYENDLQPLRKNRIDVIDDLYDFLQQFFRGHNDYVGKELYISGEGYAASYAFSLGRRIREEKSGIVINLKGIAIEGALIDVGTQYATIPEYAFNNFLISSEDLTSLTNLTEACTTSTQLCASGQNQHCIDAFDLCEKVFQKTEQAIHRFKGYQINWLNIRQPRELQESNYDYSKMKSFLNRPEMKMQLGVEPTTRNFEVYNSAVRVALKADWGKGTTLTDLASLLDKNISILFCTGEWDLLNNHIGMTKAVANIPWSKINKDSFANAMDHDVTSHAVGREHVVGSWKMYGPLSYLTMYRTGHVITRDQPDVALEIMQSWLSYS